MSVTVNGCSVRKGREVQQIGEEVAGTAVARTEDNRRLKRVGAGAGAAHVGCRRIREVGKRDDGPAGFRVRSKG